MRTLCKGGVCYLVADYKTSDYLKRGFKDVTIETAPKAKKEKPKTEQLDKE